MADPNLDLGLDYTGGIRKPTPDEIGYFARVDSTGLNLEYVSSGPGTGGFTPEGVPNDGDIIAWSASADGGAGAWVVTSRTAFSITGFAAVTALVETGATVTNPAFTASESATPETLLLTNNFDGESKDVHATPTSFASSHARTLATPGLVWTFTLTGTKAGNAASTRTASITAGQRSYAGVVAAGASLATLVAAATYNALGTARAFSFTITDDGTHKGQLAYPARYGTPIVKDRATGFGIALTLLGAFSRTNAQGYVENYNQYEFVSNFSGTITADVT